MAALAAVTAAGAAPATACAICLSAVSVTSGEQLDATDRAVLAAPEDEFGIAVFERPDVARRQLFRACDGKPAERDR